MDALFWIYIIVSVALIVRDDFKETEKVDRKVLPTPTIRFTDEDKTAENELF